ncbi:MULTISPECIES: gp19.5 family protein [unclassified Pseudomonas]|uniref:gp19.5 family protein n=1 Tax=unclassified Pseudomonas TaxID=196821 RepID=UPI0034DD16CF
MTTRWRTFVGLIRTLATHRVTCRFLGLLLVAFGVSQGGPLGGAFGNVVCVLLGGCAE